ncbi:MAG: hypothetical protein NXY57DRAFT_958307 [Lentinula lateritia]|nr:MAG: hypothetical protein NXY57DRAFT_958307 [Lentinula lateritia]
MHSLRRQASKISFGGPLRCNALAHMRLPSPAARSYSILNEFPPARKNLVTPWFVTILVGGVALSGYGGFILYQTLTMWPPEVRGDLRDAVRAKHEGDYRKSEQYFHRAWNTIRTLPIESLGSQPYLKLTGMALAFADVLELSKKQQRAYEVYVHALELLQQDDVKAMLTGPERLRAEEKWRVWAVEGLLRIVKSPSKDDAGENVDYSHQGSFNLPLLALPSWISKTDIGAPLEALGSFYAEAGRLDFAMPLYLQAISLLIPPAPKKSTPEDRCRGAQLMGNLSEMIMRRPPSPDTLHQAEAWASQALAVTKKARAESSKPIDPCEEVYAAALFNLATFRNMAGDRNVARNLYRDGLEQARSIGLSEGVVEASRALHRLDMGESEPGQK